MKIRARTKPVIKENDLKPDVAYQYIVDLLKKDEGLKQLKTTGIWNAFTMVLEKVGAKVT